LFGRCLAGSAHYRDKKVVGVFAFSCAASATRTQHQINQPGSVKNPAHRAFHSSTRNRVRPVMEVQPDIQQRSGLDQAASEEPARLPSGHRTYVGCS
jgi:hypothetical protein